MEGQLAVPLHFAAEFLTFAVAAGACVVALREWRSGDGGRALARAGGFLVLAVAQAAHGSLLIGADGAVPAVILRALGFGVLAAFTGPGIRRTAPTPVPAPAPAVFVAGQTAGWALAPALLSATAGARAFAAGRRTHQPGAAAAAGAFGAFALAELALVAAPDPSGGAWLTASHAARAVGAVLLGAWLWRAVARSVRLRFAAVVVTVLVAVILVVSAALNVVIARNLEQEEFERLEVLGRGEFEQLIERGTNAQDSAARIAASVAIVDRVLRRAESLPADAAVLLGTFAQRVDFLLFVDDRGRVLGSAGGSPAKPLRRAEALRLAGSDVVAEVLARGRGVSSPDSVGGARIVVLGAAPVRSGGDVIGAVAIGVRVGAGLARELDRDTDARISVLVGNRTVASTLGKAGDVTRAFGELRAELRRLRERGTPIQASLSLAGTRYLTALVPVTRVDGIPVGLLALSRESGVLDSSQQTINRTLFAVALAVALLASWLAWTLGGRVTDPIRSLTTAAEELRAGNLGARANVASDDEVGVLGDSFNEMAESLNRMTADLRAAFVTEETLRSRMEAIMQSMGDGLIATDADGKVVAFNRAAERMVGARADAILGQPLVEVIAGRAGSRPLAQAALSGRPSEATLERADGTALPVALTSAPLRDAEGETVGRVVVFRDVSREREAERMKSEFLANVSHELRTPLTPIRGYAEILRQKRIPAAKAVRFLDGIIESTSRLERIVDILVDFAALEAGRLTPRVERIAVGDLVKTVLDRRAAVDGRRLVRRIPAGLPPIAADPTLTVRCMNELVDNAVKFSPDGGRIEVGAEVVRSGAARAMRISVRDRGIGISAEKMRSLFQEFRQLDGSETRTFGGLGLGLAYAKRVMEAQRGDVSAQSTPGRGSTFSLLLPLADSSRGTARRPGRAPAGRSGVLRRRGKGR